MLTRPPKSSSDSVPRKVTPAASPSSQTMCARYAGCVRRPSSPWRLLRANARKSIGAAGSMAVGSTRRRLSFFVMVLCYSRLCYLEFSLGEATEHFLSAHQNAFQFLGGVPLKVLIDNPKTAVLTHPSGEKPLFHPRYLDFAAHYGFEPRACNVRRPNEKGRVESGVGYVKQNFLHGLELPHGLEVLNTAARQWMDTIANVRIHGETHKQPSELFALEKQQLQPLPSIPADTGITDTVRAKNRFRVVLDTNRFSVASLSAAKHTVLLLFAVW